MRREDVILAVMTRIFEIEKHSNKRGVLWVFGSGFVDFTIYPSSKNRTEKLADYRMDFGTTWAGTNLEIYTKAMAQLDKAEAAPDVPDEEILNFSFTESKARELGLLDQKEVV